MTDESPPTEGNNGTRASELLSQQAGNIYVRGDLSDRRERRLGPLARFMGLEHYSSALMTRKVRIELSVFAAMLISTFFFELAAWSFFLNGIFAGNMTDFNSFGTPAALTLALLFASMILFFERQVITADTWRMDKKSRRRAQVARVATIVVAGLIVAHAVDLLAFRVPVEKRLHDEAVTTEAQRLDEDIKTVTARRQNFSRAVAESDLRAVAGDLSDARTRRDQASADLDRHQQQVDLLADHVRNAREAVVNAEERDASDTSSSRDRERNLQSARRRYADAASSLRSALTDRAAAAGRVRELDDRIDELTQQRSALTTGRSRLVARAELVDQTTATLKSRAGLWISRLYELGAGDRTEGWEGWSKVTPEEMSLWPPRWTDALVFREPKWHFFQRIHTIYRMAFEWATGETYTTDLPDYIPLPPRASRGMSLTYFFSLLGIHAAAVFVPFLVFAVKWFLMPKEVDAFFSTWHQAVAGDADARLVLTVEERVRSKDQHW